MEEDEFARALLAHERREWQDPEKISLQMGLGSGMSVADLACGPGFFVVPIARAVAPSGRVYAVDSSKVMLEYLKSTLRKAKMQPDIVKIMEADVSKTDIPSSSCDVVLFANILHDIEEPGIFLREVKRISKSKAIIIDIDWTDFDNGFGPPVEIRLSEKRAIEILEKSGLITVRKIDAGPYHYGLVLRLASS